MPDLRAGSRHSPTSVLLPEPLTPVTTTKRCNGNWTVSFLRLFMEAPLRLRHSAGDGGWMIRDWNEPGSRPGPPERVLTLLSVRAAWLSSSEFGFDAAR